jgi:hypothetical protein
LRKNEWVEGIEERFGIVKVSVADVRVEHQVKIADFTKWLERPTPPACERLRRDADSRGAHVEAASPCLRPSTALGPGAGAGTCWIEEAIAPSWSGQARMTDGMENVRVWQGCDVRGSGSGAISQAKRKAWRAGKTGARVATTVLA